MEPINTDKVRVAQKNYKNRN